MNFKDLSLDERRNILSSSRNILNLSSVPTNSYFPKYFYHVNQKDVPFVKLLKYKDSTLASQTSSLTERVQNYLQKTKEMRERTDIISTLENLKPYDFFQYVMESTDLYSSLEEKQKDYLQSIVNAYNSGKISLEEAYNNSGLSENFVKSFKVQCEKDVDNDFNLD